MEAVDAVETVESLAAVARSRVTEYAVMLIASTAKEASKGGDDSAWVYAGPLPAVGDEIALEEFGGGAESVRGCVTAVERGHPFPIKATRVG